MLSLRERTLEEREGWIVVVVVVAGVRRPPPLEASVAIKTGNNTLNK